MAWNLYDDLSTHFVEDDLPCGSEGRAKVVRWIAFLYSDEEYLWPEYSFIQTLDWPMNLVTFGWWEQHKERRWQQYLEAGDFDVWPFVSKETLQRVLAVPRLLAG